MGHLSILLNNVTFSYASSKDPLFQNLTLSFDEGWTGIAGANGSGKTTLLQLVSGMLKPSDGTIGLMESTIYCSQNTDTLPNGFYDML